MELTWTGRFVLALMVGAAGCSDPADADPRDLSEAEAAVMAEAFAQTMYPLLPLGTLDLQSRSVMEPLGERTEIIRRGHVGCPLGGEQGYEVSLTIDGMPQIIGGTQTHQSCRVLAPSDRSQWTFRGEPHVQVSIDLYYTVEDENMESFTMEGHHDGTVAWEGAPGSGTCEIDVDYTYAADENTGTSEGSLAGQLCGHTVSRTFHIMW